MLVVLVVTQGQNLELRELQWKLVLIDGIM